VKTLAVLLLLGAVSVGQTSKHSGSTTKASTTKHSTSKTAAPKISTPKTSTLKASTHSTSTHSTSTHPTWTKDKKQVTHGGPLGRLRQRMIDKEAAKEAEPEPSMASRYWPEPEKPITSAPWPAQEKPITPVGPIKQNWNGKRFNQQFFSGAYGKTHAFAINGPAMVWRGAPFRRHSSFCQAGFCFTLFDSIPTYWFYNELAYAYIDETCIDDDSGDFTCTYFLYNSEYLSQRVMVFVVEEYSHPSCHHPRM
jgi:hypothetical protein